MNADTVRELLSNATPGPWAYKAGNMKHYAFSTDPLEDFGVSLQELHWKHGHHVPAEGNARLIAAAPAVAQWGLERDAEVARLREALTTLLDLHDNPPDPDQRSALALLAWMNARAALEGTS